MAEFEIDLRHLSAAIYPVAPYDDLSCRSLLAAIARFEEYDRRSMISIALRGNAEQADDRATEQLQQDFEAYLAKLTEALGEREAVRYLGVKILNALLRLCREDAPLDWTFETLSERDRGEAGRIHQRVITESAKRIFANRQHWRRELYKRFVADCDWLVCITSPIVEAIDVAYYGEEPLRWH